jgi:hypothetical protein
MHKMSQRFLFVSLFVFAVTTLRAQEAKPNINDFERSPKEIVEQLWTMATRGDLLTSEGWNRACQLFTKPVLSPENKSILIMSNDYAVARASIEGNTAKVWMQFTKLGQIDSQLRFIPAPPTNAYATAVQYDLVASHRHMVMYGLDGKTKLQDKEIPESVIWQIDGSQGQPWTTVNTAIRYVLEQKAKTTSALVKKNADLTLKELLTLH